MKRASPVRKLLKRCDCHTITQKRALHFACGSFQNTHAIVSPVVQPHCGKASRQLFSVAPMLPQFHCTDPTQRELEPSGVSKAQAAQTPFQTRHEAPFKPASMPLDGLSGSLVRVACSKALRASPRFLFCKRNVIANDSYNSTIRQRDLLGHRTEV